MTRKEAIFKVKGYLTDYFSLDDYEEVEEIIEALEQEPTLDKIRAELIQSIQNGTLKIESGNEELFCILDKYKTESEG